MITSNASDGTITLDNGTLNGDTIGLRNLIWNGALDLWRRGTSFVLGTTLYTADRFTSIYVGSGYSNTYAQDTDVPTFAQVGSTLQYSLKFTVGTARPSLTLNDACGIRTHVLGYDFALIQLKTFTISFWVKSNVTGLFSVSFMNAGFNASINRGYTISAANTWEKKTITTDLSTTVNPGSYNFTNGAGLRVTFSLMAEAGEQRAENVWFAGASEGVTSQTNLLATSGNTFRLAAVQLEPGSVATAFEHRATKIELDNAFTFYQKWTATNHNIIGSGYLNTTTAARVACAFDTPMRASPTVTFGGTASNFKVANLTSTGDACNAVPTVTGGGAGPETVMLGMTTGSAWTGAAGQGCTGILTGDATITFEADL